MRLANFIRQYKESILQEWQDFAQTVVPPAWTMDVAELRDHAGFMLDTIAEDLETAQSNRQQLKKSRGAGPVGNEDTYAEIHATTRLEAGFTINQLVSEYRALRASVLKLWARSPGADLLSDPDDVTRFNEAIDQSLAESVARFSSIANKTIENDRQQIDATVKHQTVAEAMLRESEAKFRTIADAMPQMVWSALPDGFHDYYNYQWYDFTGIPVGSTDGEGWGGMFHPEDQPRAWDLWQQSLETGATYEIEYRLRHRSGQYRWTLGRALPVRDEAGKIIRWMGTCTDVHEHKLATEKLKEADQRKDEFLAMLAHELRNPLAPISAAATLLKLGKLDSAGLRNTGDMIGRQVGHMIGLVDDLLDVSRVTQGLVELRLVPLEIHGVIDHAVEQVSPLVASRHQRLSTSIGSERCMISGDEKRLVQIFGNLLNNASKYTPVGGSIDLRAEILDNSLVVHVEDDGVGMSSALVGQVFDLFVQAERTPDRVSGGLGLGLALVKRLVELHGGLVSAESQGQGQGSRFTVSLPRMDSSDPASSSPLPVPDQVELVPQLKIMVVDDNVDAAQILGMYLEAVGHEVIVEHCSIRALERSRVEMPDVCLLDIGLPDMNGYELAKRLRSQPETSGTVLIAVTGYGRPEDIQKSLAAGFNHHLVKPLDPAELEQLLLETANAAVD